METDASRKQQQHPLPWLNLVVTEPFYFFHFLLFFSYFVARTSLSPDLHPHLLRREVQAVLIFAVYAAVKVEFKTLCSLTRVRTSRFMPELSIIYSNKNISFAIIDLGHFPNAAEKFGISLGVTSGQLPTYILFDQGLEIARLPEISKEGSGPTPTITKSLLCRYFDVDRRLIDIQKHRHIQCWAAVY